MKTHSRLALLVTIIISLLMILQLTGADPLFGANADGCPAVHASAADDNHHSQPAKCSCAGLHCCSIIQEAPAVQSPTAVAYRPIGIIQTPNAYSIDLSLDPPPRTSLL